MLKAETKKDTECKDNNLGVVQTPKHKKEIVITIKELYFFTAHNHLNQLLAFVSCISYNAITRIILYLKSLGIARKTSLRHSKCASSTTQIRTGNGIISCIG